MLPSENSISSVEDAGSYPTDRRLVDDTCVLFTEACSAFRSGGQGPKSPKIAPFLLRVGHCPYFRTKTPQRRFAMGLHNGSENRATLHFRKSMNELLCHAAFDAPLTASGDIMSVSYTHLTLPTIYSV